ncbi:MAG: 4Fe-4S binding protein [Proteobacteria bacterium]|nr:4Fe-4S binding protein [Pseudomonadota bacterium]
MEAQYNELAKRVGLEGSERIPRLFKMLADLDEVELLLAMPGDVPALAEKLNRPQQEVAESIQALYHRGLAFPNHKTDPPTYRMPRTPIQFHDATILWPEAPQELLDLWHEWDQVEWPDVTRFLAELMPRSPMRVVPVGVTVQADSHILAQEDVNEVIKNAKRLAVTKCPCRMTSKNCDHTVEACLQVNRGADYAINRGTGRELTKEEALDLLRQTEKEGLVHCTVNHKSIDSVICNCCPCCCSFLEVAIKYGNNVVEPSRFQARVDEDLCSGCEICLERCPFGAIEMKSKNGRDEMVSTILADKCLGCGVCRVTCPEEAISLVEIRDPDYVPEK